MTPFFWSLILLAIGMCVIVLELFLPSAGMLGVLAGLLIISGIVCGFMSSLQTGGLILLATVLALPMVLISLLKIWPQTPIGRRILLDDLTPEHWLPENIFSQDLVGQLGIAKTKMLPSGIVLVNDQKLDAVSHGFAIEPGQPIIVTAVKGNRIYVELYEGSSEDVSDLPVRDRENLSQPFEDLELDA